MEVGLTAVIFMGAAAASIARYQPYFGNMDDSALMELASESGPLGTNHWVDPASGFLRHSSWALLWAQYAWAASTRSADVLYLLNAALVLAILVVFALACRSFFRWNHATTSVVLISAAVAWPFTSELLFFPSLQEKAVILGGSLLLWWVAALPAMPRPWVTYTSLAGVSLVAFTSKTQILLLVPGLIAALWVLPGTTASSPLRAPRIAATAVWSLLGAGLIVLASTGDYASATRGASLPLEVLEDRRFLMLCAITVAYSVAVAWRYAAGFRDARVIVPWVWTATACGAFLVWDMRNYYLAVASVGVSAAVAVVVDWVPARTWRHVLGCAFIVVAIGVLLTRTATMFGVTHSFREFLASPTAQDLAARQEVVGVGCLEAPGHFTRYAEWEGLPGLGFAFAGASTDAPPRYVLADSRLCPLPGVADSRVVWQSAVDGGYTLYLVR